MFTTICSQNKSQTKMNCSISVDITEERMMAAIGFFSIGFALIVLSLISTFSEIKNLVFHLNELNHTYDLLKRMEITKKCDTITILTEIRNELRMRNKKNYSALFDEQ